MVFHQLTRKRLYVVASVVAESADSTGNGGRGHFAIAGARVYHIVTGYAVAILLPRLLGSPQEFGLYAKVMVGIQIINNVLVVATLQSVSKFVGADTASTQAVFRRLLTLQLAVGALVAGAVFAIAPLVAEFHRDQAVVPLLRVVAIVPLCYAIYATAIGYLNGLQRFERQALLDVTFHTLRVVGVLGGAALLSWGALAPISGVSAAAVLVAGIALLAVGVGKSGGEPAYRDWIAFMAPLWAYHAIVNSILELDVQVLAKTVSELAVASGQPDRSAVELANTQVGLYHAAQKFAFVPYQLMLAITFVVFPKVARATDAGDDTEARRTIRSAMRLSLLVLLSVAAPLAGAADGVLRLAYPEEYLAGAPALEVLSFGIVACSLFVVAGTILTSAGRPLYAALIALSGLVVAVTCTTLFVRHVGIGEHTLAAAALGTSTGMGVAFLLAGAAVYARFRTLLPPGALLRGAVAAGVAFAVARFVPHDTGLTALAALAAGFGSYLVVLVVLREIRASDLRAFSRRESSDSD